MRMAIWNCAMALHRKFDAMLRLRPDIAVICECAEPKRLQELAGSVEFGAGAVWVGNNRNKGLAVFGPISHLSCTSRAYCRVVSPLSELPRPANKNWPGF